MSSTDFRPFGGQSEEPSGRNGAAGAARAEAGADQGAGGRIGAEPTANRAGNAGKMGDKIYVASSPGRGRGVFAAVEIAPGELIERSPVIVIPGAQEADLDRTVLYNYTFAWDPEPQGSAIALGYGSIYNHAPDANARYEKRTDLGVIDFIATRRIALGEEIFINYNGDADHGEPVWFDLAP